MTRIAGKQYRIAARCPHDPHGIPVLFKLLAGLLHCSSSTPTDRRTLPPLQIISVPFVARALAIADCGPGPSVWKGAIQKWIYLYRLYKEYDEIEQHCMRKMPSRLVDYLMIASSPRGPWGDFRMPAETNAQTQVSLKCPLRQSELTRLGHISGVNSAPDA